MLQTFGPKAGRSFFSGASFRPARAAAEGPLREVETRWDAEANFRERKGGAFCNSATSEIVHSPSVASQYSPQAKAAVTPGYNSSGHDRMKRN
jgi:hypothetical protein